MALSERKREFSVNGWNAAYLEEQYAAYKRDPESVPADMRWLFLGFDLAYQQAPPRSPLGASTPTAAAKAAGVSADVLRIHAGTLSLIEAYRSSGHMLAALDPFDRPAERPTVLTLEHHQLSARDLDAPAPAAGLPLKAPVTLRAVVEFLERIYCGHITVQAAHVSDLAEREWVTGYFERGGTRLNISRADRIGILEQLMRSEGLERFIGKRYGGEKRFSGEGGESMAPLFNHLISASSKLGVEEMIFGMSHRGRTTCLKTVFNKSYEQIFTEFEGNWHDAGEYGIGGDVRVHRGHSGTRELPGGGSMYLVMASNPSHLEAVDPIVLGRARGKQRLRGDAERKRVAPVLVHGDAAMIGQGIVFECLNLAKLPGYEVGGTIHVVVNNLIGFTTEALHGRSCRYCTDGALMIEAPVVHVNGEDPEAVVAAANFAAEYRHLFGKDVVVDMLCYRRHGHNEQDEPSFTQPVLCQLIADRSTVGTRYAEGLIQRGDITQAQVAAMEADIHREMDTAQASAKTKPIPPTAAAGLGRWAGITTEHSFKPVPTGVSKGMLEEVCTALGKTPDGFHVHPKLKALLEARTGLVKSGKLSYADAESLAWGTLLLEGNAIRLTGQDSRRGTFSHRHAVLRDAVTQEEYTPLNHMRPIAELHDGGRNSKSQARLCMHDSPLSELAVMGFDYGYSLCDPKMLVMWEAQFGDFCNGGQMIIDQFIASGDMKWHRWSGMVLLLPQGFEGMGPEHSSARPERFLQLCGQNKMQVVCPSTAAQCFHMFRRQLKQAWRTPLIVLAPKSLLRVSTSTVDELTSGHFQHALDDPKFVDGSWDRRKVERVLITVGKIAHDVMQRRDANHRSETAIIRLDQIYPFDAELVRSILAQYPAKAPKIWLQEEARNQGAHLFLVDRFRTELGIELGYIGRPESASVAVGPKVVFKVEQEKLTDSVCGPLPTQAKQGAAPAAESERVPALATAGASPKNGQAPRGKKNR